MKWELTRGNEKIEFPCLKDVAIYFNMSYSYVAQLIRYGRPIKGWTGKKIICDQPKRVKYTQIELLARMEALETKYTNLRYEFETLKEIVGRGY